MTKGPQSIVHWSSQPTTFGSKGKVVIVQCQCGQKNRVPDEPRATCSYLCGHCRRDLNILASSNPFPVGEGYPNKSQPKRVLALGVKGLPLILVVLSAVFYNLWRGYVKPPAQNTAGTGVTVPAARNPVEAKEWEIVEQDAEKLGDPELTRDYQQVNERYFDGGLPRVPVLWEPRLKEVGPFIAKDYTLEGLAEDRQGKIVILINPAVGPNQAELRRVLCHEMVHVYLFTIGDMKTNHGPAFQSELHRLSLAGAFRAISATEDEKLSLRSSLKSESSRLDAESIGLQQQNSELDSVGGELGHQNRAIEQENHELNQRISRANEQGYGWPADDEIEAFKARSRILDQRLADFNANVAAFNASVERHNADLKRFNHQVSRYNLIMAYPDGLDEDSLIQAKRGVRPRD